MKTFKNTDGVEWQVSINVASVKAVRDEGYDLLGSGGSEVLATLRTDPVASGDIAFVLCQKQAEERGLDRDAFLSKMGGKALADACTAIEDEIEDFFPSPEQKKLFGQARQKFGEASKSAFGIASQRIQAVATDSIAEDAFRTETLDGQQLTGLPE